MLLPGGIIAVAERGYRSLIAAVRGARSGVDPPNTRLTAEE